MRGGAGSVLRVLVSFCFLDRIAGRFVINGPLVTITLKDPDSSSSTEPQKWLDLNSLKPNAVWSLQSKAPPIPNWLPFLKSIRSSASYNPTENPFLPSHLDVTARFSSENLGDLEIQPSFQPQLRRSSLVVQATRGNSANLLAKFSFGGRRFLEYVKSSCLINMPFSSSVGAVKVEPSFDFVRSNPKCLIEAITSSGRTKAVLNMQWQDPTLSVVHALDSRQVACCHLYQLVILTCFCLRNTISPEISLHNAKIMYRWNMNLDSGSINTVVDPTEAIHVKWTDRSMNGRWVTDFSLPLRGTTVKALAANVRVRRQFSF